MTIFIFPFNDFMMMFSPGLDPPDPDLAPALWLRRLVCLVLLLPQLRCWDPGESGISDYHLGSVIITWDHWSTHLTSLHFWHLCLFCLTPGPETYPLWRHQWAVPGAWFVSKFNVHFRSWCYYILIFRNLRFKVPKSSQMHFSLLRL